MKLIIVASPFLFFGCTKKSNLPNSTPVITTTTQTSVVNTAPTPEPSTQIPLKSVERLEFVNGPNDTESGFPFELQLKALDREGQIVSTFSQHVLISIEHHPQDGDSDFLSGPNYTSFTKGEAKLNTLSIEKVGEGYILKATSGDLSALSKPFNILPLSPKDVTLIMNGKKRKVKFEPPNILIDTDGDRMPVFSRDIQNFTTLGKHYKIKIVSPTEVIVDEIPPSTQPTRSK